MTKVRWVPNRGLLLLMQPHQLIVYCIESKSTLTRMNLPGKYAPFSKWLTVQGTGTCLGTGDDGGANTLICEHEVGPTMNFPESGFAVLPYRDKMLREPKACSLQADARISELAIIAVDNA